MRWQTEVLLWCLVIGTLLLIDDVTGSSMLATARGFFIVKGES